MYTVYVCKLCTCIYVCIHVCVTVCICTCIYLYLCFDKLIWHTIGPKSFLFGTAQFSYWASDAVNYDYIVTNNNC